MRSADAPFILLGRASLRSEKREELMACVWVMFWGVPEKQFKGSYALNAQEKL